MDMDAEFSGDLIGRLIEGDMLSGECWRPAATLDFLVQSLVILTQSEQASSEHREVIEAVLSDVMTMMVYLEVDQPLDDEETIQRDIDLFKQAVEQFNNEKEGTDDVGE